MSVWKNRANWRYRVMRDGVVISGSARSREEALALEARARTDLIDQRIGAAPRRSLPEAFVRYFTSAEALNLKSIDSLVSKGDAWEAFIAGRQMSDAVAVADKAAAKWQREGKAVATINRRLALLRRILNLAYRKWGWLNEPMADKIQLLSGEAQRHIYLTAIEAAQLRRRTRNLNARAWITLLLYTGLRAGELESLTADQVRDNVIYLDARTKTGRPRAVPVVYPATRYLKYIPMQLKYQGLRMHFEAARKVIGRPDIHIHDLRHTNAAWLAQAGAESRDLQVWLGHTNPATTARYAHLSLARMKDVARKLRPDVTATQSKRLKLKDKSPDKQRT